MYEKVLKLATRISRSFDFLAGVYFENNFIMNNYDITLTYTFTPTAHIVVTFGFSLSI